MSINFRAIVRAHVRSGAYEPKTHGEYKWAKACASKVWFKAEAQAARAAARYGHKAYKCKFCDFWHIARRKPQ